MRLLLSYFAIPPVPLSLCDLILHRTPFFLSLILEVIPEVDVVATEVEDNVLNTHIVIGLDTPVIDAISYMADLPILLVWLSLLIIQQVLSRSSSTHQGVILMPGEYEEYLRLIQAAKSSSITFVAQAGNVSACLTHSYAPWILDIGASDHISGNKDIFSSLTFPYPLPTITLVNGSQSIAKGIDSVCSLPSLPLTSVLYVLDFPFNLISISKLTRDLHCVLTFSHNFVTLQDRSTGKMIGIGHESQGFFHLSSPLCFTACTSTKAPLLLHNHLSHPSLSKFQKLVPHFSNLSSLECESWQLRKHTHVLFPNHLDPRTKSSFKLVHTDVWGPSRSTSTLGFRYFVNFIDDYSRCTWLFLMKTRAELFFIFKKFHAEIRTNSILLFVV